MKNKKRKNHSQFAVNQVGRTVCPTVSTAEKKMSRGSK